MAKVFYGGCTECRFLWVGFESHLLQGLEDLSDVLNVIFSSLAEDQNVINEGSTAVVQSCSVHLKVNPPLEFSWRVLEAEGKSGVLPQLGFPPESGDLLSVSCQGNLVVTGAEVELGEEGGTLDLLEDLLRERKWVGVGHCGFIDAAVIDAEPTVGVVALCILLGRHGRCTGVPAVVARDDQPKVCQLLTFLVLDGEFQGAVATASTEDGFGMEQLNIDRAQSSGVPCQVRELESESRSEGSDSLLKTVIGDGVDGWMVAPGPPIVIILCKTC